MLYTFCNMFNYFVIHKWLVLLFRLALKSIAPTYIRSTSTVCLSLLCNTFSNIVQQKIPKMVQSLCALGELRPKTQVQFTWLIVHMFFIYYYLMSFLIEQEKCCVVLLYHWLNCKEHWSMSLCAHVCNPLLSKLMKHLLFFIVLSGAKCQQIKVWGVRPGLP